MSLMPTHVLQRLVVFNIRMAYALTLPRVHRAVLRRSLQLSSHPAKTIVRVKLQSLSWSCCHLTSCELR